MKQFRQMSLGVLLLAPVSMVITIMIAFALLPEESWWFLLPMIMLVTELVAFFGGIFAAIIAFGAVGKTHDGQYRYRKGRFGVWAKENREELGFCQVVWVTGFLMFALTAVIIGIVAGGFLSILLGAFGGALILAAIAIILLLLKIGAGATGFTSSAFFGRLQVIWEQFLDFIESHKVCPVLAE